MRLPTRRPSARRALVAASLLPVAALAACADGTVDGRGSAAVSGGGASPSSSAASSSGSGGASASAGASVSVSTAPSSTSSSSGLSSALLTPDEIGTGYTGGPSSDSAGSPLPCTPSAPPLFTQVPPGEKVQGQYQNAAGTIAVSETLAAYTADADATRAIGVGTRGFTCSSGTLGGDAVRIVKRPDVPSSSGSIEQIVAWDFATASGSTLGTALLARDGRRLCGLVFLAQGEAGKTFPTGTVVQRALDKLARLP